MKESREIYLWEEGKNKNNKEVQEYWTKNVNTTQFWDGNPNDIGSSEFFTRVREYILNNYAYRYKMIRTESAKYRGGNLLEIGCGAGWESVAWAKEGMKVTGIDLSKPALKLAEKNFEYNNLKADLRYGNGEELDFEDNTFDIVSSMGVLHHTKNMEKAISEIYRVLKPSGEAVLELYHRNSWKLKLSKISKVNFEFDHEDAPITKMYDKESLRNLLNKFSSVEIDLDYIHATPSLRKEYYLQFIIKFLYPPII